MNHLPIRQTNIMSLDFILESRTNEYLILQVEFPVIERHGRIAYYSHKTNICWLTAFSGLPARPSLRNYSLVAIKRANMPNPHMHPDINIFKLENQYTKVREITGD